MPWVHTICRRRYEDEPCRRHQPRLSAPNAQRLIRLRPSFPPRLPLLSQDSQPKISKSAMHRSRLTPPLPETVGREETPGNRRVPSAPSCTIACPLLVTTTTITRIRAFMHHTRPRIHRPPAPAPFPPAQPVSRFPFPHSTTPPPRAHHPLPGSRPPPLQGRAWDCQQHPHHDHQRHHWKRQQHPLAAPAPAPTSTGSERCKHPR
jgi:hypothetical protein